MHLEVGHLTASPFVTIHETELSESLHFLRVPLRHPATKVVDNKCDYGQLPQLRHCPRRWRSTKLTRPLSIARPLSTDLHNVP